MTTRDDAAVGAASAIAARRWAVGRIPAGVGPKYPQVVVLMGATGDLSRRKLLPGLFQLSRVGFIPGCRIIGVSRDDLEADGFRTIVREALHQFSTRGMSEADWAAFAGILDYVPSPRAPARSWPRWRKPSRLWVETAVASALPERAAQRCVVGRPTAPRRRARREVSDRHGKAVRNRLPPPPRLVGVNADGGGSADATSAAPSR